MVDAACSAASASTSHRALDTLAAAANNAARVGKVVTVIISRNVEDAVPAAASVSRNGSSTIAAVAAAHREASADVKGNIAALLAPWFAYVSQTAALLAFKATASVARASTYSLWARK